MINLKGIDVSTHQGVIDWKKVADSGIEFVIIRAGYGKSTVDKYFTKNIKGAISAGLKIGVYWFIYALNESDAIKNAEMFHKTIKPYKEYITMKVFADYEYDSENYAKKKGVTPTKNLRTKIVKAFLNNLKAKGWEVGNYANPDYIKSKFNDLSEYPLWLAWYSGTEEKAKAYNPFMYQYSSTGSVPGIKGNVDMNICYCDSLPTAPELKPKKTVLELALEVINGLWGNGDYRKKKLAQAGHDSKEIQKKVNELLKNK